MSETIEDIVREMRDGVVANDWYEKTLKEFADRVEAAYKGMPGMWIVPAENAKLREENERLKRMADTSDMLASDKSKRIHELSVENARLKAALKPVQNAHIPDFSICDTCRDRSECAENEDDETCEWYDIVESVRESQRIYNGGVK